MKVAIVDDDAQDRSTLTEYLQMFSAESGVVVEQTSYESGDAFLATFKKQFDVIVFDIEMPGTNGMDTAFDIRAKDPDVIIMFVTNMAQYAINGYEVEAVDYIIKPVSYYDFVMKFQRAATKVAQKRDRILMIKTDEGVQRLRTAAILYVEVQSHYLFFHTAKDVYKSRGSIQTVTEELSLQGFVQVHRSFIVNLRCVDKITHNEVIIGGDSVPVGRAYRNNLKQSYMRYVNGAGAL